MPRSVKPRPETTRSLFTLVSKRIDSIPALPLVRDRVLSAIADETCSPLAVSRLIETDPALTAKVLRVINSPFYGRRLKVSTLSHGVAMLGLSALRNITTGIATFPEEGGEGLGFDHARAWLHSLGTALASRSVARLVGYDLAEEAYTAGLLHDIGQLVMELYAPSEYRRHRDECEHGAVSVLESERRYMGTDHCQVGALVAENWNLPGNIREAIQYHHDAEAGDGPCASTLVGIVSAANRICWEHGLGSTECERGEAGPFLIRGCAPMDSAQIDRVRQDLDRELVSLAIRLGLRHPSSGSLLSAFREANRVSALRLRSMHTADDLSIRVREVAEVVRRVRSLDTVDRMVEEALALAQSRLGFDRIVYLQADLVENRLRGKFHFDSSNVEVDIHGIDIPLNPKGIMASMLDEGRAQRVDNWTTDGELLRLLGVVEVAAAPVIVSGEPIGIFCADYFFRNREVTDADVALLDIVGFELALAVESMALSEQARQLRSLAARDGLTGINNRRNLMKLLQAEIDRASRYRTQLSAVMLDIDAFKSFNDSHGHQAGDRILAEVAQLVVSVSREIDVIGRYGGEEFLAVLPETELDQAIVYAERLRAAVEKLGKEKQGAYPGCRLTISLGVTCLEHGLDDIERLIHRVDGALYAAKNRGRNRVCVD